MDWELMWHHQMGTGSICAAHDNECLGNVSTALMRNCFKKWSSLCCDSVQKDHDTDHVEKSDHICEQEFDWVNIDHDLQVHTVLTDKTAQCIIN
jgi:hypothetical protein